ncbi:hypothetical protein [Kribbella sp. NPDC048915]|uniref:hypothetical protein n=1 Tax=Kribbella sp. NPDC048915 TaxID=3155148 RepID=UPI0033EFDF2C
MAFTEWKLSVTVPELSEPTGRGRSSTMPHKRNPVLSTLLRRAAVAAPALASTVHVAACLAEDELGIDSPGIPAGLHARVPLPASTDAADLARRLGRDHGIALLSLDAYLRSHALPPELIVGFAAPSRSGFGQAVDALMAQLRGLSDA